MEMVYVRVKELEFAILSYIGISFFPSFILSLLLVCMHQLGSTRLEL